MSKQQANGLPGLGNLKAELLTEANRHCQAMGLELQVTHTSETAPPYVLGNYPRAEVQFMCLPRGEAQRPNLKKAPDTVIEVRP